MNKWIEFGTLLSPLATLFAIITFFMGIITPLRKKLKQKNTKKVVTIEV